MTDGLHLRRSPGRRARLSDAETQQRMLDAGARFIAAQGLSLSLEHLSIEELIAEAGVSRTSSYRRWPTKDAFAADLLLHVAQNTNVSDDLTIYVAAVRGLPPELLADIEAEQGRRNLTVEMMRVIAAADFTAALNSPTWRSFVMLRAAHGGLPDGKLRIQVAAALGATERSFQTRRSAALRSSAELMGYRLNDPATIAWDALALLTSASHTGLLIQAYSDPETILAETPRAAFGSTVTSPWNAAALAPANLFFGATEPDPTISWDASRITDTRAALRHIDQTLGRVWASATPPQ